MLIFRGVTCRGVFGCKKIATFEGFRSLSILRGQDFLQWCIGFSKWRKFVRGVRILRVVFFCMGSFHGIIYNHCLLVRPAIRAIWYLFCGGNMAWGEKWGSPDVSDFCYLNDKVWEIYKVSQWWLGALGRGVYGNAHTIFQLGGWWWFLPNSWDI